MFNIDADAQDDRNASAIKISSLLANWPNNKSLVKGKSIFYSPKNRNEERETHINFINNIDIGNEKSNKKSNFSPKE